MIKSYNIRIIAFEEVIKIIKIIISLASALSRRLILL